MSRKKKSLVGKVGFVKNSVLGFRDKYGNPSKGGHYVYIKSTDGARCDVNVITSLESVKRDRHGNVVKDRYGKPLMELETEKIGKVRKGYLYAVPKDDADFTRWSAINLDTVKGVRVPDIEEIGSKRMKRRHSWFAGKFGK